MTVSSTAHSCYIKTEKTVFESIKNREMLTLSDKLFPFKFTSDVVGMKHVQSQTTAPRLNKKSALVGKITEPFGFPQSNMCCCKRSHWYLTLVQLAHSKTSTLGNTSMLKVMVYSEWNSVFINFYILSSFCIPMLTQEKSQWSVKLVKGEMLEKTWSLLEEVVFSQGELSKIKFFLSRYTENCFLSSLSLLAQFYNAVFIFVFRKQRVHTRIVMQCKPY